MNYLIARVSDVNQRKALPAQKKKLFDYAKKKSWDEKVDFKYIEFDETAFKDSRKKFQELVIEPLLQEQSLSIVVFDKVDRFSRQSTSEERVALTKLFRKGKIELHFPSDNLYINKDSPGTELFHLDINVALAAYYSNAIRDNVKRRFDEMIANKTWIGKAPIGYLNVITGYDAKGEPIKDIEFDPIRKDKVHEGFELRSLGWSYGAIAKKMKEDGFAGKARKNKYGKLVVTHINKGKWEEIINNPFYVGKMRYMGGEYPHKYPTLVEPWLWDKCQWVNRDRRVVRSKYRTKPFLFKQLKCAIPECNCTITFDGPKGAGMNTYGKCTNYRGLHESIAVNEKVLIEQVKEVFKLITVPKKILPSIIAEVEKNHSAEQEYYRNLKISLQKEHDKLDEEIRKMFEDRETYRLRMDIFESDIQGKTNRQKEILQEQEDLSEGNKGFTMGAIYILELCSRALELFESEAATIEQKRYLLETVLTNVKLRDKKLEFNLVEPFGAIAKMAETGVWCE